MNMIVSAAALTAGSKAIASVQPDDSVLLELEEKIFEHHAAATEYDAEINRLGAIVQSECRRLYDEALAAEVREGRLECYLKPDQRWAKVSAMVENEELPRLIGLQDAHWYAMDGSVEKMWTIPAHTPEGRRAKVSVLLGVILDTDWRQADEMATYEARRLRSILFEFIGGEPGEQMRDQFA
jgi:hypothetical protein